MTPPTLEQGLPAPYDRWLRELLPEPIPVERKATCDDCALCVKPDGRLPTATYTLRPDAKCCIYAPRLPNFRVGAILADESPETAAGRRSLRERLASENALTPLGLGRIQGYEATYRATPGAFGQDLSLRCPHYLDEGPGLCGIWRHREATCATWFCRHSRGRVGLDFWHALRALLACAEDELARWCALELRIDPEALGPLLPRAGDAAPPPDEALTPQGRARLWGRWGGRPEAFFRACAERVAPLAWGDVRAIAGPTLALHTAIVSARFQRLLAPQVPERLRLGPFHGSPARRDGLRAVTFSRLDALDLPAALLPLLPRFDGRPTADVLRELAEDAQVAIEPGFLQELVDWEILVPPEGDAELGPPEVPPPAG